MQYPKDPEENKRFRLDILQKARKDPELQGLLIAKCEEDPLFFINVFCWTYDPRAIVPDLPFITYKFQDKFIKEIIECIETGQDNCTEKSRDMGYSWMLVAVQIWAWRFKKWDSLYGSYKEDYVDEVGNMDSHFERIRYILDKLPTWMLPEGMERKYMNISYRDGSSVIAMSGDSGQNFGTGGRRKFIIMDEFSYWQFAANAFRKTRDVTRCRILGGTPSGRGNIYGRIMTKHPDYEHLNIKRFRLHWTEHPLKDQEWYEQEKLARTPFDLAQEVDISYDQSVLGAVYPDFANLVTLDDYDFELGDGRKLYTSWDFGRDMTAIIWVIRDYKKDQHIIIDSFQKKNTLIEFFAAFITGEPVPGFTYTEEEMQMIKKHKEWAPHYSGHFGDPYNADSKSGVTNNTFKSELAKYGIHLKCNRDSKLFERIRKTALGLRFLHIDEQQHDFIHAIQQSRYPEPPENAQLTTEKTKPVHDENSHFRTTLEYYFDNIPQAVTKGNLDRKALMKEKKLKKPHKYGSMV